MLNPAQDAIDLINEFGTKATLRVVTRDFDSQSGEPLDSFEEKAILVLPYSLSYKEKIQNPLTLTEKMINITTKKTDACKVNDEIIINSITYVLREANEQPIFSHIPSGLDNEIPFVSFKAQLKQTSEEP